MKVYVIKLHYKPQWIDLFQLCFSVWLQTPVNWSISAMFLCLITNPSELIYFSYVSLSDNEKTGYKARELKSVHVDAVGLFLKLNIHKNHVNRYNLYNQVMLTNI